MISRNDFGEYLNSKNLKGIGAEVGVAYGENAESILRNWQGFGIFLIDPYDISKCDTYIDDTAAIDFDSALVHCRKRLSLYQLRTIHIRENSDTAFYLLKGMQLDFVYLDGNHHNPQITRDLNNYWSIVKEGGILCGHDYYNLDTPTYRCEVKDAVDKFLTTIEYKEFFVTTECTSWWIVK